MTTGFQVLILKQTDICTSSLSVARSRKTVRFSEQMLFEDNYSRVKWRPLFIYENLQWRFNQSETKQKLRWKPYWNGPTSESERESFRIFSLLSLFATRCAITSQVLASKQILANDPRLLRFAVVFFAAIWKHMEYCFIPPLDYYFQRIETITFFSSYRWI